MILWRISADTPLYEADDLSGKGAEKSGGRWNAKGVPAVYASSSRALACLETAVHLNMRELPLNRYLVEIVVPDAIWTTAEYRDPATLKVGWDAEPAGKVSIDLGTAWLLAQSAAVLITPSVIVPEEFNVLINPRHPDSGAITARKVRSWRYDPRLTR